MTKAHRATKALKNDGTVLGWSVYWSIPQDIEIPLPDLEVILKATIGEKFMPAPPRKKRALRLALMQLEAEGRVAKIRDDIELTAYALVKDVPDAKNIDISMKKLNMVIFVKESKEIQFRGDHKNSEIQKLFDRYCEVYVSGDVRTIATRFIHERGGVILRRTGGNYLLRSPENVEMLDKFIESFPGAECYTLPIAGNRPEAKKDTASMIHHSLRRDLELAAEDVKRIIGSDATRTSTFEQRLEDFKLLKNKCEIYKDLLKDETRKMTKKVDELSIEVLDALTDQVSACPLSTEFPYKARVEYSGSRGYGQFGTVVGFRPDRVKVLFEESQNIVAVLPKLLTAAA